MATMPWFRYYSELTRDRKLVMAAKTAGISKIEMIGAWSILLCLANDSPIRGKLLVTFQERFTVTDIETELETDATKTNKIIAALMKYEMLEEDPDGTIYIVNWVKRQFDSDNSTSRVKRYREKQHNPPNATLQKRYGNAPDTDTDTDTDTESTTIRPAIFKVYEDEIGMLTPMISEELQEAEKQYPSGWTERAIQEAARNNKRNWAYARAILRRWRVDGFESKNSHGNDGRKPPSRRTVRDAPQEEDHAGI